MLVTSPAVTWRLCSGFVLVVLALAGCGSGHHARPKPRVSSLLPPFAPLGDRLPAAGAADPGRPNIVFVLADDLNADLLPFMPHVQELAKRGIRFSKYIVSDSLCCPSRASLFTGELPHNTKVFTNSRPDGGFYAFRRHADEAKTFNVSLYRHGYRTALEGKYLNGYAASSGGVPNGWSSWSGTGKGYHGFDYTLDENGRPVYYGSQPTDYLTDVLAYQARRFVSEANTGLLGGAVRDPRPLLLEVATFAPHLPATPAPRDAGVYPHARAPRTPGFGVANTDPLPWLQGRGPLTPRQLHFIDAAFQRRARSVVAIDQLVGNLEDELRRNGQLNNTYFVFSSDNGLHMGQHRLLPGKKTAFDTDIRVPLIIAGPGVPAGRTVHAIVQNTDIAPTFEELAGAPVPSSNDGRSLVPFLRGKRPAHWRRAALVEHRRTPFLPGDPDRQPPEAGNPPSYEALRLPSATYVEYEDGLREYYDDRRDPAQLHNVYATLPAARQARLHQMVLNLAGCRGSAECFGRVPVGNPAEDGNLPAAPRRRRRLLALAPGGAAAAAARPRRRRPRPAHG
ncbi:MAG: N-acetylglucosamine-6-sulfatase [Solirubrobacteraceae bacterium]|nr:N-acetylglucosamine-6-sulfatase [Solirubrobacteraceae bacterium]